MTGQKISKDELDLRFTYHPPRDGTGECFCLIRERARRLADVIVTATPSCREQSVALTKLEEVVMWANAGIARRA